MALSARALVILRGEGCRGPFVLLYSLGEGISFKVILLDPRSGVLSPYRSGAVVVGSGCGISYRSTWVLGQGCIFYGGDVGV